MTRPVITFRSTREMVTDGTIRRPAHLDAKPEATSECAHPPAAFAKPTAAAEKERGPSADRVGRLLH
jgi:hypothetical protein